jgi:Fe-S cluster assembly protein SufD
MKAPVENPPPAAAAVPPAGDEPWRPALDAALARRAAEPDWLRRLRRTGRDRFAAAGLPTLRDEDWRFTNLAPLRELEFLPTLGRMPPELSAEALDGLAFADLPGDRLVFVDGHYAPALSQWAGGDTASQARPLSEALTGAADTLRPWLERSGADDAGPFAALNQAAFSDGAWIEIPAGRAVADPVHLLFVSTGRRAGTAAHPRNVIVARRGCRATFCEHYVGLGDQPTLTNAVTDLVVEDGARVEHLRFQEEAATAFHLGLLRVAQGRDSFVAAHSFSLGARLFRLQILPRLEAEGAECVLNGLYLVRDRQLADHHMVVEHARPRGVSHEYFNGILADAARGVFHGRILVQPGAQKTDAKQTNKNLLLSETARVNTKPQLEIYADDVRCTHGATVGQLDPEAIFYLRARGIARDTARRMLVHSFAAEITDRVACAPLREKLDRLIWDWLEALDAIRMGDAHTPFDPAATH